MNVVKQVRGWKKEYAQAVTTSVVVVCLLSSCYIHKKNPMEKSIVDFPLIFSV